MKKVIFFTNVVSPYRHRFFNLLAQHVDLTVIFRGEYFGGVPKFWHGNDSFEYKAYFLNKGPVKDKLITFKGLKYLFNKYDYLIFTNYGYVTDVLNIFCAIALRKKFYFEFDGLSSDESSYLIGKIKKFLFLKSSGFFSPSKHCDLIINSIVKDKEIIRYPFSSIEKIDLINNSKKTENHNKNSLAITVIGVGRYVYGKGVDLFYKTAKSLPEIKFIWIGGDTSDSSNFAGVERPANCTVVPFQSSDSVKKFLASSDIFFLPTRNDVWGLVINEAMALGLPIITTTRCGAGLELVSHGLNGFLVDSENVPDMVDKISIIARDNHLRHEFGRESLRLINTHTIQCMVEKHVDFFCKAK